MLLHQNIPHTTYRSHTGWILKFSASVFTINTLQIHVKWPWQVSCHIHYWCHLQCRVQHALYFKRFNFVLPYFSHLFSFNTLSAEIELSIKSASMFCLAVKRGSVCYSLLVAEHGFVSTGCGTHLYHLSPAIFTVTSLETLRRPYH